MATTWQAQAERYVGYYDIMGFKRLMTTQAPGEIYRIARAFHDAAREAEQITRSIRDGGTNEQPTKRTRSAPRILRFVQFSDSVVVFSRDASSTSSLAITLASIKLFIAALSAGFLIRGAWARGLCLVDFPHSIFFGQPVIDAYQLAEAQQWFGVVEHDSVQSGPTDGIRELGAGEIPLTEPYPVPLKTGTRTLPAIAWPLFADSMDSVGRSVSQAIGPVSGALHEYRDSTLAFAGHIRSRYCSDKA